MLHPPAPVVSGVAWFDDRGIPVNAHGGCIVIEDGRYYLFGEYKTDDRNVFAGFSCYSSPDLATWRFEGLALAPQPDGLLGPDRIGERPAVLRCPATGRYVMFLHADDLGYTDPHIAYAVSDTVRGPYVFGGAVLFEGEPVRRWDVGAFQDDDGTGYLLVHEGDVYRLADDYTSAAAKVASGVAPGGESPGMVRAGGRYHLLFSNKTSWERNDNYVMSAPTPAGPWQESGLLAPAGSRTHDSQCGFVLTGVAPDAPPMYLGDRWSFPRQASAATYVWQPLQVDEAGVPRLGPFLPAWMPASGEPVDLLAGAIEVDAGADLHPGQARATEPFPVPPQGRVALFGMTGPDSGYARITLAPAADGAGDTCAVVADFYSGVVADGIRFLTPPLAGGRYRLTVEATGDRPMWSTKDGTRYGAADARVRTTAVRVLPPR